MQMEFSPARIRNIPATQLCRYFSPSQDACRFVTPRTTTIELLHCWRDNGFWFDAALLLAHALHKRPAIWWAYLVCAGGIDATDERQDMVLRAVERWLREPDENNRANVCSAASSCEKRDPRYWLAMAVHWCSDAAAVAAGASESAAPFLYARAVAAAIDVVAALPHKALTRDVFYQTALLRGIAIASGESGRVAAELTC